MLTQRAQPRSDSTCALQLGARAGEHLLRCAVRGPDALPRARHLRTALWVSAGYALVLMQLVNYPIYRATGLVQEAVQGRYLFPVIVPLVGALCASGLALLPERARLPVAVAVAAAFVALDFPYLLANADAAWFDPPR